MIGRNRCSSAHVPQSLAAVIAAASLLLALAGCSYSPLGLPVVKMKIGSQTYHLEVAADRASREHGLMQRASLPHDAGMIFVFASEQLREFWMKDTLIPLDILFLDASGKVVSIHTMKPLDLSTTSSERPAQYAIELNAGAVAKDGAKVGDQLSIPSDVNDYLKN